MIERRIIYAPWREEFVLGPRKEAGCIFCNRIAAAEADAKHFVVHRGERVLVMLNLYPYTSGHVLVVPYRHISALEEVNDEENYECACLMQRSVAMMKRAFRPDGFTLGLNLGRPAGAGIPEHLHWHVVARWAGDSNFLPVIGGSRLVSVRVEETYRRLMEAWHA
jgi:ATP adenylyltransferase